MLINSKDMKYNSNVNSLGKDHVVLEIEADEDEVLVISQNGITNVVPAFVRNIDNTLDGAGEQTIQLDDVLDQGDPEFKVYNVSGTELSYSYDPLKKELTIIHENSEDCVLYYTAGKGRIRIQSKLPSVDGISGRVKNLYNSNISIVSIKDDIDLTSTFVPEGAKIQVVVNADREVIFEKVGTFNIDVKSISPVELSAMMNISTDQLDNLIKMDYAGI